MTETTQRPAGTTATSSAGIAVAVRDLHVHYGEFEAVRGIDLDVRRGEVFALLGTNGAGKTTTLEVLEGFGRRSGGTVSVLGLDPATDRAALRQRMGVQLQEGGFVEELTVQETLELWQRLVDRPDRPQRLMERFELDGRRGVPVGKLSGGEKRRLDLALAVWGSPELVVLDEPTTGLDPGSRRRTWDAIQELQEAGRTVVLTTHYLEEAEALADRVAIMHAGRVAVAGTLAEIVATQPARFSATLPPGREQLPTLTGTVEYDDDQVRVRTEDLQGDLTTFLGWAAARGVRLSGLRAAPASLTDVYHSVRDGDHASDDHRDDHRDLEVP
ncbi:ABC transporter ATP-binding protein [Pseudonocardia sp. MH-G8]|uniref:ABC transporter ATP-binding protein n=1 Tax=Pseudonocardia sp. MH-G8 TaxID=1854588 RepID=UPI000BA00EC2|nr:ABC transporter ATP-binding protein [Pseudonocardia sp. MH-G8]OZM82869.1 multidrug ABC transporter ATP-binding protein [Pseudonocardia sp. MH-G8]